MVQTKRLTEAANERDYIVEYKDHPKRINTITPMGDGKFMVLAMENENGHYIVTAIDTKKGSYVESLKKRGVVLDVRGGTPYSPSATSPEGAARQPERLSGVTDKEPPGADQTSLPDDYVQKRSPEVSRDSIPQVGGSAVVDSSCDALKAKAADFQTSEDFTSHAFDDNVKQLS